MAFLKTLRSHVSRRFHLRPHSDVRGFALVATSSPPPKPTGDISSVFPSLSGATTEPLPPRFAGLKSRLIHGHEDAIQESWIRLLSELQNETELVATLGPAVVPELSFSDLNDVGKRTEFRDQLHKRGAAIIRGVVSEKEALAWMESVKRYVQSNPSVKGFPSKKPAVYELYWTPSQILARAHPNVLEAQAFLMSHWHSKDNSALMSTSNPTTYADRLRIRQPGDTGFALGPHVDAGSCERWEEDGYGRGDVYRNIFNGTWENYDPWESSCRLPVIADLYNGAGSCSMFRMFQGWLSMSTTGPGEGTLMVNPLLRNATAYFLLRPFFRPKRTINGPEFLDSNNWIMEEPPLPVLQGAVPSNCQELNDVLHPHLRLESTMVHVPTIRPGDYVAWHCDTIHAVDKVHAGTTDASVLYIPSCPLTEANAKYLVRQRESFVEGNPPPDFPSNPGERDYIGRLTPDFVTQIIDPAAQSAMGLARFGAVRKKASEGEQEVLKRANAILGFK